MRPLVIDRETVAPEQDVDPRASEARPLLSELDHALAEALWLPATAFVSPRRSPQPRNPACSALAHLVSAAEMADDLAAAGDRGSVAGAAAGGSFHPRIGQHGSGGRRRAISPR